VGQELREKPRLHDAQNPRHKKHGSRLLAGEKMIAGPNESKNNTGKQFEELIDHLYWDGEEERSPTEEESKEEDECSRDS